MTTELQNKVWRILPAEFRKVVKAHYAGLNVAYDTLLSEDSLTNEACDKCSAIREKMAIYNMYFGQHNLTSDAEGEDEMLCVSRKQVQAVYAKNIAASNSDGHSSYDYGYYDGVMNILSSLFGSRCLPDIPSSEQKPAEMTEGRYQYLNSLSLEDYDNETSADEQRQFCEYQHKHHPDEVIYLQTHSDEKPKPSNDDFNVPEPNCKHFKDGKCAHPSVSHFENGKLVKGADCDVSSCEDVEFEPKAAEPKDNLQSLSNSLFELEKASREVRKVLNNIYNKI